MKSILLILLGTLCYKAPSNMTVYVFQSGEVVNEFQTSYYNDYPNFEAMNFTEDAAQKAIRLLEKHMIGLYEEEPADYTESNRNKLIFGLDKYYVQLYKYKSEGSIFYGYEMAISDPCKEDDIPKDLVVVDGGGISFWKIKYNLTEDTFLPIRINAAW